METTLTNAINEINSRIVELIPFGLPLLAATASEELCFDRDLLLLKFEEIAAKPELLSVLENREKKALGAFLWAISTHFRKTWHQIPICLKSWSEQQESDESQFQLRRMSLEALGRYL